MNAEYTCIMCDDDLVYSDEVKTWVHRMTGAVISDTPETHLALPKRRPCYAKGETDHE